MARRVAHVRQLPVFDDPRVEAADYADRVVRLAGRRLHARVDRLHLGPCHAAEVAVAETRLGLVSLPVNGWPPWQDDVGEQRAVVLRGTRLEVHVDVLANEALGQLAHRDLRRPPFRSRGLGRGHRSGLVVDLLARGRGAEHERGPAPCIIDREARTPQPDPLAKVLAREPVADEKHLLSGRQHPQDEPGERVAGQFVHGSARLGVAHESGCESPHTSHPPFDTNSSQARVSWDLSQGAHSLAWGRAGRLQTKCITLVMSYSCWFTDFQ